jgi:hypothetical protein
MQRLLISATFLFPVAAVASTAVDRSSGAENFSLVPGAERSDH